MIFDELCWFLSLSYIKSVLTYLFEVGPLVGHIISYFVISISQYKHKSFAYRVKFSVQTEKTYYLHVPYPVCHLYVL